MSDTDRYAVIGHPIAHSKSPIIHQLFAKQTGEQISYEALDVLPEQLQVSIISFTQKGGKGLNVTLPHKRKAAGIVDTLTDRARIAGAVNTITQQQSGELEGDNTDGVGLVADLTNNLGIILQGARIAILGAGGATHGIVPQVLEAHPEELVIANRSEEKAKALADCFLPLGKITSSSFRGLKNKSINLVIKATSARFDGVVPPFPESNLGPDTICYDLSYSIKDTPFVAWSRNHGSREAHQGWGMLVEQAAESFCIWRGIRPDTDSVLRRLR